MAFLNLSVGNYFTGSESNNWRDGMAPPSPKESQRAFRGGRRGRGRGRGAGGSGRGRGRGKFLLFFALIFSYTFVRPIF